jgi:hypothetical protein
MGVKAITQSDPTFLKTVYKHDSLVDLVNHERFVDIGERYIVYTQKMWRVYKMGKDRNPRLCGYFTNLHLAVANAN